MSLDKAIASGKEKRTPYRGGKSVSNQCKNHGSCPYCRDNRMIANKKREVKADDSADKGSC